MEYASDSINVGDVPSDIEISSDLDVFIYTNENDIQPEHDETSDMIESHDIEDSDACGDLYVEREYDGLADVAVDEHVDEPVSYADIDEHVIETDAEPIIGADIHEPTTEAEPLSPEVIFIVPYRNRENDLAYFLKQMHDILLSYPSLKYEIKIIHQNDDRPFNRGAIKNLGFLYAKQKYPDDYTKITFVFNDVDTTPNNPGFDYMTHPGTVKHFFGFRFALGGIVSIAGCDFEAVCGFPNFWQWGYEDNLLQERVLNAGIIIDRRQFKEIGDSESVNQIMGSTYRNMNIRDLNKYKSKTLEGIYSIYNIKFTPVYETENTSLAAIDLKYHKNVEWIDVDNFTLDHTYDPAYDFVHDLQKRINAYRKPFMIPRPGGGGGSYPAVEQTGQRQIINTQPHPIMKSSSSRNRRYKMQFI